MKRRSLSLICFLFSASFALTGCKGKKKPQPSEACKKTYQHVLALLKEEAKTNKQKAKQVKVLSSKKGKKRALLRCTAGKKEQNECAQKAKNLHAVTRCYKSKNKNKKDNKSKT